MKSTRLANKMAFQKAQKNTAFPKIWYEAKLKEQEDVETLMRDFSAFRKSVASYTKG